MVVRKLPSNLVKRIRGIVKVKEAKNVSKGRTQIKSLLGRLKNVDHRSEEFNVNLGVEDWGGRVREINISRNYPSVKKLILKYTHDINAKKTLVRLFDTVSYHNKKYPNSEYYLYKPYAYPVGEKIIAMSKASAPSLAEMIGSKHNGVGDTAGFTKRGEKMLLTLSEKTNRSVKELRENLANLSNLVEERTLEGGLPITRGNLLCVGVKNGKFVFVPLADYK